MRNDAALRQKESFEALSAGRVNVINDPNLPQKTTGKGRLDSITLPGINLYGKQHVLSPVENGFAQDEMGLKNIQCFFPDQCGHQGQSDQPEMFQQVFLEWFRYGKVSKETAEWAGASDSTPVKATHIDLEGNVVPKDVIAIKGEISPGVKV